MYRLYGRPNSGSFAVQVALEEAQLPYERIWVGTESADLEQLRAISPTGKVPALTLPDGSVMFESAAMLLYLASSDASTAVALLPGTTRFALFQQWMVFLSANVYEAVLRMYYAERYSTQGEATAATIREQGVADFCGHLALITASLAPYVLGGEYTIADTYLYMLASWYPGEKSDLFARLPALTTHAGLVAARPAVAKVNADHAR